MSEARDPLGATLVVLRELRRFAKQYAGTSESVQALLSRGEILAYLGDYELAGPCLERVIRSTISVADRVKAYNALAQATVRPGLPAPSFSLKTIRGKGIKLEQFRGRFVLLAFWAAWSRPSW